MCYEDLIYAFDYVYEGKRMDFDNDTLFLCSAVELKYLGSPSFRVILAEKLKRQKFFAIVITQEFHRVSP